jgi:two-component system, chemotaxis family, chemotaxis protein CheY
MKHCLVVDDSEVIRKVARRVLETMQFEVSEAENGEEALLRCQSHTPDAILLDWQMPVMNGLEFLGSMRLANLAKKPFVIYCTTENDPSDIARAFAAGANEYILKPFDRETIEAKLMDGGLA